MIQFEYKALNDIKYRATIDDDKFLACRKQLSEWVKEKTNQDIKEQDQIISYKMIIALIDQNLELKERLKELEEK